ncbi:hypothetical protein GCM10023321_69040 [Pseudonocardia eucalypti]|uniref:Tetracyclin repressor-like C-terminal domain-containing protein n=1 Tax=Pseudonocardia eucalypti TaxID=648755 RepID=A0ABP9R311_9PSEU|nr:AcrR family transcriptional regulator [Pseudonocardia eucalypti]
MEAIAERSGAAKTTTYRHWPDKGAVLGGTIESIIPMATAPDSGSLRGDLARFAEELAGVLSAPPTSALVPALVDSAERDTAPAKPLAGFTAGRRAPIREAVARAAGRGEIDPRIDAEAVAELFLGPIFYRRLLSREPLDAPFTARTVNGVMAALPLLAQGSEPRPEGVIAVSGALASIFDAEPPRTVITPRARRSRPDRRAAWARSARRVAGGSPMRGLRRTCGTLTRGLRRTCGTLTRGLRQRC